MTTKLQDIEHRYAGLATKSADVVNDDREWATKSAEWEAIEADLKSIEPELKALRSAASRSDAADLGNVEGEALPDVRSGSVKSIGEQVMTAVKGIDPSSKFQTSSVDVKATFGEGAGGAGLIIPQYRPGVTDILFRQLTIADLLASGTIDGSTWIYLKESSVTNAAAAVAEGGLKPASDLNLTQVTETLKKVATTLKITDEMLLDYSGTTSYVNGRLVLFVQLAEEDQLLNGSGSGANMTGLLNRSGLTTTVAAGAGGSWIDAIYTQMTAIRTAAFIPPDGIVVNPLDWQTIRLSKDANKQYYGGGPFTGAYGNGSAPTTDMLWGLPVVVTPAIAAGTALVGAFKSCAQVMRQGGIRVDMTNSNEDDFLHNLVAVRAELRELLAVYRPSGFGKVSAPT